MKQKISVFFWSTEVDRIVKCRLELGQEGGLREVQCARWMFISKKLTCTILMEATVSLCNQLQKNSNL